MKRCERKIHAMKFSEKNVKETLFNRLSLPDYPIEMSPPTKNTEAKKVLLRAFWN